MECFKVLGIEVTTDQKIIRKAYSELLPKYSPEKDPEGFQGLRKAYEEAQEYARSGGESTDEARGQQTPEEAFISHVEALYNHFEQRLDVQRWKTLLDEPVCHHIDTAEGVQTRLLQFLMSHYHLPQDVWQALDATFSWSERREALCADFPEGFVEYIINGAKFPHLTMYEELLPLAGEAQSFLDKLHAADDAFEKSLFHRAESLIAELEEMLPGQTNVQVLKSRVSAALGRVDPAVEFLTKLKLTDQGARHLDVHYYRGEALVRLGRMEEAQADYQMALEIKPESTGSQYHLAKCHLALGKYEDAIHHFEHLVKVFPTHGELRNLLVSGRFYEIERLGKTTKDIDCDEDFENQVRLAELLYQTEQKEASKEVLEACYKEREGILHHKRDFLQSVFMAEEGNVSGALDLLERLLEERPLDGKLWFQKAENLHNTARFEEAIVAYENALLHHDEDPVLYNNFSHALNQVGRHEEAIHYCNLGIRSFEGFTHLYKNRAVACKGLGRHEEVVKNAEKALSQYPGFEEVYHLYFESLKAMNRYQDIHSLYKRALEHDVPGERIAVYKADAFKLEGRFEDATEGYEYILSVLPDHVDAHYGRAHCYMLQDNIDRAMELIEESMKQVSENRDRLYDLLGDCYAQKNDYNEALKAYEHAARLNPAVWSYHYGVGHAYSELEKFDDAIVNLSKALEQNKTNIDVMICMSYCYYSLEAYEDVVRLCDQVLRLEPDHLMGLRNKAWAQMMLEQYESAHQHCDLFLSQSPDNENMLTLKVRLYQAQSKRKEALEVIKGWLEQVPDSKKAVALREELNSKPLHKVMSLFGK